MLWLLTARWDEYRFFPPFWMQEMPKDDDGLRVAFERPIPVQIMAIDGTWRRSCALKDVSENGATLQIETSIEGLSLNEFFLVLSTVGLAYRRCQLDRVNGEELQVVFLRQSRKNKRSRDSSS